MAVFRQMEFSDISESSFPDRHSDQVTVYGVGRNIATGLILISCALMTIGVVMLASVAADLDKPFFACFGWQAPFVRQCVFAVVGFACMFICLRVGPDVFRWRPGTVFQPSIALLIFSLALLAAVWMPEIGIESHGRRRWIGLGSMRFQPSEIAKIAMIVFLAAILSRSSRDAKRRVADLTLPVIVVGLICALVGAEDFGSAVLLAFVAGLMIVVRGCPISTVVAWMIPAVGAFTYLLISHPYRIERLFAFLRIWEDPNGAGYHPIQSLTAIASGGIFGEGLGAGMAKYGYLPECRTDFIFSVICEETGLFGGGLVILLFAAFVVFGWFQVSGTRNDDGGFSRLFAFGVVSMVVVQALINLAVVTVVAPTKGIALPLVSAGGSSLISYCIMIGLLAGVRRPLIRIPDPTGRMLGVTPGPLLEARPS